jgi:hypothetical protein
VGVPLAGGGFPSSGPSFMEITDSSKLLEELPVDQSQIEVSRIVNRPNTSLASVGCVAYADRLHNGPKHPESTYTGLPSYHDIPVQ